MKVQIQRLSSEHDRTRFDCGDLILNRWLAQQSLQQQVKNLSRSFVLVDLEAHATIIGYYTLTLSEVAGSSYPSRKSPPNRLPVIRLARLAVSEAHQSQGMGELLLMDAVQRAQEISRNGGGVALAVDAKHDQAAAFYQRYGFTPAPDIPLLLFLILGNHLGTGA
ncbi:GNAT family N-acetyltransferase [Zoogloea dura]|uniref:GNAT family N-acetyltransferase n=1 Tax=Zoogloea dura TaxID=2728840 RepID=A0A848G6D1_9RHOO|nr:GNAT family N-acetyltransferase [Zoogloea dura]NML27808.1 GNAT family N-acetyltransferase [Zoogloea dura]